MPAGRSTDEGFLDKLDELLESAIDEELLPLSSLEAFFNATIPSRSARIDGGDWECLASHSDIHAPVLAALGRLQEAAAVASGYVEQWEPVWQRSLAEGEALIAGHKRRSIGRDKVAFATQQLALIYDLKTLAELAGAGDRLAVAALLRDWERQKMRGWELEDIWEPQPFPLELGNGA